MKNAILVDSYVPDEWIFCKAIETSSGKKWEVECLESNKHGSFWLKLVRYIKYFALPWRIFVHRKEYASILAWQQFYGLILAFYLRLFHVKKNVPNITVMTFIYKPKKGVIGKLYAWFMKYVVTSGYIKKFVVFSKSEKTRYADMFQISEDYFVAEKLGIDDKLDEFNTTKSQTKYYVSAGRSNRDYEFIRKCWPAEEENRALYIICDVSSEDDFGNITYLKSCHGKEYLEKLAGAYATVVPLNEDVSSGQLVFLQSMMLGKPIIVTKNQTIAEYIEDGKNGFIIDKDISSLSMALEKLDDKKVYREMSENARNIYEKNFSIKAMGESIGKYL